MRRPDGRQKFLKSAMTRLNRKITVPWRPHGGGSSFSRAVWRPPSRSVFGASRSFSTRCMQEPNSSVLYVLGGRSEDGPQASIEARSAAAAAVAAARRALARSRAHTQIFEINAGVIAVSSAPTPALNVARCCLAAASVAGTVFAVGGAAGEPAAALSVVESLAPGGSSWTSRANLGVARAELAAAALGGRRMRPPRMSRR
jgi:hypothetical protein